MIKYLAFLLLPIALFCSEPRYAETLYDAWGQTFQVEEVLFEMKTDEQHLIIFENPLFGRVLALDGIIQVTEKDEFIYHEMLTHVPIFAHGNVRSVLIIGGGDGGMLREVLRHPGLKATLVEIDQAVIDMSKQYLPSISRGAFDNPRVNTVIADGAEFVKNTEEKYDLIICDSTDPIGPGEVLFTSEFYRNCCRSLASGGIFVTQNGVPFLQEDELVNSARLLNEYFEDVSFYTAVIPTYVGGFMTFGWATNDKNHRMISQEVLEERIKAFDGSFKYYTPAVHKAAFALPQFIGDKIERANLLLKREPHTKTGSNGIEPSCQY